MSIVPAKARAARLPQYRRGSVMLTAGRLDCRGVLEPRAALVPPKPALSLTDQIASLTQRSLPVPDRDRTRLVKQECPR